MLLVIMVLIRAASGNEGAMATYAIDSRNKVLRLAKRGHYDEATVFDIVDSALICHVAYEIDGQPYAMPTLVARDGHTLLLHGQAKSRTLQHAGAGNSVCVTVTHVDGIVLARSVFNHSINYRCAMLYGHGRLITDPAEKLDVLYRFTEKLIPGRWDDVRPSTEQELQATAAVAVEIESASAKVRTGMPSDEPDDLGLPTWAGVVPVRQVMAEPLAEEHTPPDLPIPGYLQDLVARNRE
jgi:nitroimidazol reductase NimA-like FMN-containing flavoprotein (pyridoxamine 5'-phosphate oxidase superfamily)